MVMQAASDRQITFSLPHTLAPTTVSVQSPAFGEGLPIPPVNSAYGASEPPEICWRNIPAGTQSLALVCEDPDAENPCPFVHWILYNIPPDAGSTHSAGIVAAAEGVNSRGLPGYSGPRPPAGDRPHHYHFQVFALDALHPLPVGIERRALLDAIAGHVIAKGELVGTFTAP